MLTVKQNLLNGFFTEPIDIVRRTFTINQYGENSFTETTTSTMASVQPTPGKELDFLPDFALESETLTFFSLDPLYSQSTGGVGYSDIVVFNGNRYQIIKSKLWKTHTEAIGVLEAYSEQ
jgi:hypothetical protein